MCCREEDDGRMATYVTARERVARTVPTYIFDMDGTLSLMGDRDPYDWARTGEDLPNAPVVHVAQRLQLFSTVVVVSGRDESCRRQTEFWLNAREIFPHALFMRPAKDNRPDYEIKREIWTRDIQPHYTNILGVFDDRPQVIRLWRELGLFVFDCGQGRGE